jgi:hypothetical protein
MTLLLCSPCLVALNAVIQCLQSINTLTTTNAIEDAPGDFEALGSEYISQVTNQSKSHNIFYPWLKLLTFNITHFIVDQFRPYSRKTHYIREALLSHGK